MARRCRRFWPAIGLSLALAGLVVPFASLAAPPSGSSGDWAAFRSTVQPFLDKHCFECHDDTARGDVRLDTLTDDAALAKAWETVERAGCEASSRPSCQAERQE